MFSSKMNFPPYPPGISIISSPTPKVLIELAEKEYNNYKLNIDQTAALLLP
jgi:hypothetical protein